jgi:hypothetical protein
MIPVIDKTLWACNASEKKYRLFYADPVNKHPYAQQVESGYAKVSRLRKGVPRDGLNSERIFI